MADLFHEIRPPLSREQLIEKWPRQYADVILSNPRHMREELLNQVPERLQGMVQTYLEIADMHNG